jgi:D-alanyl-lipoteichoic acid acyltransferase DltB (MBOAT superfamily)
MYTIQIYCDFAGYSLMAIGIAKTLGFDLINNFERPYLAASVTEFWKRWHISLTRWLTTHVYINMGGNRCSKARQYFNILVTFLVSGLWHGANWTFVVWGALHGLFQIVEKMIAGDKIKAELKQNKVKLSVVRIVRILITFNLVSLAWIFFRMPTIEGATAIIGRIVTDFGKFSLDPLVPLYAVCIALCLPILLVKDIRDEYLPNLFNHRVLKWAFYVIVASFTICLGVLDCGQFIYVNF